MLPYLSLINLLILFLFYELTYLRQSDLKTHIFFLEYGTPDTNETLLLLPTTAKSSTTTTAPSTRPPRTTPAQELCSEEVKEKCQILRDPMFSKVSSFL